MKIKNFFAIAIAVAAIVFIILQLKKTKDQKTFILTGEWQVDSTYATGNPVDSITFLLASKDVRKEKLSLVFNADSTLTDGDKRIDSAVQKYYLRDSVLYVDEGKGFIPYHVLQMNDNNFSFVTNDSLVVVLKKK